MRVVKEEIFAEHWKGLRSYNTFGSKQRLLPLKNLIQSFTKYIEIYVPPTGCLLFDNRLVTPAKLRPLVL